MDPQSNDIDSTTDHRDHSSSNETPTVDSTNPNYNPHVGSFVSEKKIDLKTGQQHADNIIVKTKKLVKQQLDQTCHSLVQVQKKIKEMLPKQCNNLIYWRNPILSGIVFGISISVIITFIFMSSLAAISFWSLALLAIVGLYKLYNYVMVTFIGRAQDDIFDSIFPPDMSISERRAQELAHHIRVNGTSLLKHARALFLWDNLTNSLLFGLVLFVSFYIGLSMNALTFALVGLIFVFTVPKIYQVYQVPIDRTAKQVLDQINQLLAKVTSKLPNKAKKA